MRAVVRVTVELLDLAVNGRQEFPVATATARAEHLVGVLPASAGAIMRAIEHASETAQEAAREGVVAAWLVTEGREQ